MNKTVNINLANTFFHIDEVAYAKLKRYLEAIRTSFEGTKGHEEILNDIESRIAELFSERMEHDRQVITQKEVDDVIQIMGQPEDYLVDEDIFQDQPKKTASETHNRKKLYRNEDEKLIGGICAGLEHFLGIDKLWIRLGFVLLTIFTSGFWILLYFLLWFLVPAAATTAQKLDMRGEPINISNIERKVKEGFDDVAEKVKNVDYNEVGNQIKSSSRSVFDTLGDILKFIFKGIGKFIGALFVFIGGISLIALCIFMIAAGVVDSLDIPGIELFDITNTTGAPIWLGSILTFFAVGIPFFFLMYLGLKLLLSNLKSIGNAVKLSLLAIWLIAVAVLIGLAIKQASEHAYTGTSLENKILNLESNIGDTIYLKMNKSPENWAVENYERMDGFALIEDDQGSEFLFSEKVSLTLKSSENQQFIANIKKDADGSSRTNARERAKDIVYEIDQSGSSILLNEFFTTSRASKIRNQRVRVNLLIPEGKVLRFDESIRYYLRTDNAFAQDIDRNKLVDYLWTMGKDNTLICLNCPDSPDNDPTLEGNGHFSIDKDGIDIDLKKGDKSIEMKVDENGIKIKTNKE